jgi:6,7-dimethyl-8-ribityllumazine synthase
VSGRYAIVLASFYEELAERLLSGAFELPLAASYAARTGRFDGVACLGAVIRGQTDHYDFVCAETANGIMRVSLDSGVPCSFGVLTCSSMEQALARSGGDKRDQGRHAAEAVLRMSQLSRQLEAAKP